MAKKKEEGEEEKDGMEVYSDLWKLAYLFLF